MCSFFSWTSFFLVVFSTDFWHPHLITVTNASQTAIPSLKANIQKCFNDSKVFSNVMFSIIYIRKFQILLQSAIVFYFNAKSGVLKHYTIDAVFCEDGIFVS